MIKYKYAYNEHNDIVSIEEVDPSSDNTFHCIQCSNKLVAKQGDIRHHHFAHLKTIECSNESYLHKLSKEITAVPLF